MTYNISGTAVQGLDLNLMNGFLIIPTDSHSYTDTSDFIEKVSYTAKDFAVTVNKGSFFVV